MLIVYFDFYLNYISLCCYPCHSCERLNTLVESWCEKSARSNVFVSVCMYESIYIFIASRIFYRDLCGIILGCLLSDCMDLIAWFQFWSSMTWDFLRDDSVWCNCIRGNRKRDIIHNVPCSVFMYSSDVALQYCSVLTIYATYIIHLTNAFPPIIKIDHCIRLEFIWYIFIKI